MSRRRRRASGARRGSGTAGERAWAVFLLLAAGAAGGIAYNVLAPRGIFAPTPPTAPAVGPASGPVSRQPVRPSRDGEALQPEPGHGEARPAGPVRVIDPTEAKRLQAEGRAVFLDARSAQAYALGHIPKAHNLPSTDFDAFYPKLAGLLGKDAPIVVYCTSANCDESDLVIEQLVRRGHRRLLHFKEGWNTWENLGLPQERGAGPVGK